MPDKQQTFGQFNTPIDVADLLLTFCLHQPGGRILDPSCGPGDFLARAAQRERWLGGQGQLWGIELDPELADQAQQQLPQAQIVQHNFFDWQPEQAEGFTAVVGNPPYTRAEWIDQVADTRQLAQQLAIFDQPQKSETEKQGVLNRRAGLYAHFLVHSTRLLTDGGRLAFVVPNNWLDVAYGTRLKQFLLDHYKIIQIIESNVERWFAEARVNTCLLVLERCQAQQGRAANTVRLSCLKRPLAHLLPPSLSSQQRFERLAQLQAQFWPDQDRQSDLLATRVIKQQKLTAEQKWGALMRAPAFYHRHRSRPQLVPLGRWATIERGYTTGANAFFYLDEARLADWPIETTFRQPLLKSLRPLTNREVDPQHQQRELLTVPATAALNGTQVAAYITWGQEQGWHQRRTCRARTPWYSLPPQPKSDFIIAKGTWQRHFVPLVKGYLPVDQQLYRLALAEGVPLLAAGALFNSSWFALQLELQGRVNFGEGVLWLATYELAGLRLPDLRYIASDRIVTLSELFRAILKQPVRPLREEVERPERYALDEAVFELLGFSAREATAVIDTLLERIKIRQQKATTPA